MDYKSEKSLEKGKCLAVKKKKLKRFYGKEGPKLNLEGYVEFRQRLKS